MTPQHTHMYRNTHTHRHTYTFFTIRLIITGIQQILCSLSLLKLAHMQFQSLTCGGFLGVNKKKLKTVIKNKLEMKYVVAICAMIDNFTF